MGGFILNFSKIFNRNAGLSLVEILVALFIFVIALVGISGNALYIIKFQKINEKREEALLKAETVLNNLITLSYNSTCLASNGSCSTDNGTCCGIFAGDSNISWNILEDSTNASKEVTVTVSFSYQDYNSDIELSSIKGDWQ